jgi:hypothetical protein
VATIEASSALAVIADCQSPLQSYSIPAPPALGESLGPLSLAAAWLLNAASLPLALIVGLVGFGLLGSVISTFVQERAAASMGTPTRDGLLVSDLMGVILRGLSAAIVVFLAVQGGLAVLSGAGGEPNPYVILLACFVAAVFSERVWASACEYLATKLPQRKEEVASTGAPAPGSQS